MAAFRAVADESAEASTPDTVKVAGWVEGPHLLAEAETWASYSAVGGDPVGLTGTDLTLRPGYGFRFAGLYLVARAHAVASTIWWGAHGVPIGWSDPAVALAAPALIRRPDTAFALTPTVGFTVPATALSPITRAFTEILTAVDLPPLRFAAQFDAERVLQGEPRPVPLNSFQRHFSCTTSNLECLFRRPLRESWSARLTTLVEFRTAFGLSAGARMSVDRLVLMGVRETGGGWTPPGYREAFTFSVHAAFRVARHVGITVTATENGRPLALSHPLRLPFTEASEAFFALALWVRTDPGLEPYFVEPYGG